MWGGVVNKFNKDDVTKQFINSNGSITDANDYSLSDYIPISGTMALSCTYLTSTQSIIIGVYNANKEFIRRDVSSQTVATETYNGYLRICANTKNLVDINTIMLNEGSTALPYEPYYKWIED